MTTLLDLVRDVTGHLYSLLQVKDKRVYLASDITDSATTITLGSATQLQSILEGQVLQFSNDDGVINELMRVRSKDTTTNSMVVTRAVLGTTAVAWTTAATEILVEPQYPMNTIVREINNTIQALAPAGIFPVVTTTLTVDDATLSGYQLPNAAMGVIRVEHKPNQTDIAWMTLRRYKFDPVNKIVQVFNLLDDGQPLKVTYRAYPTSLVAYDDDLADAGYEDHLRALIAWGALYRLLVTRAGGRLVDSSAQTPMNQQYRHADPVTATVRQIYALYQQELALERERFRLQWPVQIFMTF